MNLTILGCRAGMPANGQASSGYLVSTDDAMVLLDCGPGIATALSAIATPDQLDAAIVSHLHLDHCYDLLPIGKSLLAQHLSGDVEPILLYVPEQAADRLKQLSDLFPIPTLPILERAFDTAFDLREYAPKDQFTVADLQISLHELRHSSPNCGVRLKQGAKTLAYTGDTGVTPALLDLAQNVDVLLAEASLLTTDHTEHGHLSATDAAQAAATAGAKTLILTHFPTADPTYLAARRDEARAIFPGDVHLAQPGQTFTI